MKNIIFLITLVCLFLSCQKSADLNPEYTFSGKIYNDCSKSRVYANTLVEVRRYGVGFTGSRTEVIASTTTGADGSFSVTYKASKEYSIAFQIPANPAINLYSPIDIVNFNRGQGIDEKGDIRSMVNQNFYLYTNTQIKVKLKCNKVYSNQDTLYVTPKIIGGSGANYEKIVAPQDGQIIVTWTRGGIPDTGAGWGLGWEDYTKMRQNGTYNRFKASFPSCENSPSEYVLEIK